MSVLVVERMNSRSFTASDSPSAKWLFAVFGAGNEVAARDAARLLSPPAFIGMRRLSASVDPQGGGVYFVDVEYGKGDDSSDNSGGDGAGSESAAGGPDRPGQGDDAEPPPEDTGADSDDKGETEHLGGEYSFDTGGGTVHITQSKRTVRKFARQDPAHPGVAVFPADHKGAIGIDRDTVHGCDIVAPKLEFQYTGSFKFITLKYLKTLRDLTGTVNQDPFFHFAAGEVLFLGAAGQFNGTDENPKWKITFRFAAGKNETNIHIVPESAEGAGDDLTVSRKDAWEYLWVEYGTDLTGNTVAWRPATAAYVEEVYDTGDFKRLAI